MTYYFTFVLETEISADKLYDSGCDDSLVYSMAGVNYITFDREANSLEEALESAKQNVETAGGIVVNTLFPYHGENA
jgi:hypothetical protein